MQLKGAESGASVRTSHGWYYWAGIERVYYAATIHDALEYGGFDDTMIYGELCKPVGDRSIPSMQMLRAEAVEVWKKYKAKPDKVPY